MANYLEGMTGFEVIGGTPGTSSPWLNQGGAMGDLQKGAETIKQGAKSLTNGTGIFGGIKDFFTKPTDQLLPEGGKIGELSRSIAGANDWINDYFVRGVVIILGFIFIAAGLAIMGRGETVVQVVKGAA